MLGQCSLHARRFLMAPQTPTPSWIDRRLEVVTGFERFPSLAAVMARRVATLSSSSRFCTCDLTEASITCFYNASTCPSSNRLSLSRMAFSSAFGQCWPARGAGHRMHLGSESTRAAVVSDGLLRNFSRVAPQRSLAARGIWMQVVTLSWGTDSGMWSCWGRTDT